MKDERIKLVDIENVVLGVPSFYRPYFIQHKKINTLEAVAVYCFGHTLYEMTFGSPLHGSVVESYPTGCPSLLSRCKDILRNSEFSTNEKKRKKVVSCFFLQFSFHNINS